ncbi:MAG: hypothetical protein ATN36_06550 [Epulopiscium sp. Nele67-Bin005]|nr:MAG: hypothetical protein ATN36_06550 [Epulopiscium sp. Nele67-Bin005]
MNKYDKLDIANRLDEIAQYCKQGATEKEIYTNLGVTRQTWISWKNKYSEFAKTLQNANINPNLHVENALYRKATGQYLAKETKTTTDETGAIVTKVITEKEGVPDVGAITFWLKNRCPDKWKDKIVQVEEIEIEDISDVTTEIFGSNDE